MPLTAATVNDSLGTLGQRKRSGEREGSNGKNAFEQRACLKIERVNSKAHNVDH